MKYIDRLINVSNSEFDFQRELINIKNDIKKSSNQYKEVNLLINNINKYCEKRLKNSQVENDYAYLLEADDFCMFILNRLLNKTKKRFELHKECMIELLRVKSLSPDIKNTLNKQVVNEVFTIIDVCFPESTRYSFEKVKDKKTLDIYSHCLKEFNLEILFEISGVKPIVFVAEKGKGEANITKLGIILMILDKEKLKDNFEFNFMEIYSKLINQLVESCMVTLLEDILTDSNLDYLSNKYGIARNDLKIEIGKDVALYLSNQAEDYSSLLRDVITLSKKERDMDELLEKHMFKMSQI